MRTRGMECQEVDGSRAVRRRHRSEREGRRKGGGEDRRVILENVRERKGTRRGSRMRMV